MISIFVFWTLIFTSTFAAVDLFDFKVVTKKGNVVGIVEVL